MLRTTSTFQYNPISIARDYDFLKKLPLYLFYDKLENIPINVNDNYTQCNNFTGCHKLQEICNKIVNILDNIKEVSKLVDVDDNNNRSCKYLNYLVQEEILNVQCDSETLPSLYVVLNKYNISNVNYNCNLGQNINTDNNIYQTTVQLNYYAEYLYWIKEKLENIPNIPTDKFFLFLNECVLYYNTLLKLDACNQIKKYENALNDFREKYEATLDHIKIKYTDITPFSMLDVNEAEKICNIDSDETDEWYEGGFEPYSSIKTNLMTDHPTPPDINSNSGYIHQHNIPDDSHGLTLVKATPYIGSAAAIFIFLFVLHKFTPLGAFLRNKIMNDRNRMKEKQDHKYKSLSNESHILHNIAYQSVGY